MATHKNFTLNEPGDAPPWGATEYQAWQDLIDTVVEDCVDEEKKITGHKHFKMYEQTSGDLALTILDSGTGKFISGDFAIQNNLARLSVETYSTTITDTALIYLRHSHSNTVETVAATGAGEVLGEIQFQGVDSVPAVDPAAAIRSTQVGATDTQIGANLTFWTALKGGTLAQKMILADTLGAQLGLGTATPMLNVCTAAGDFVGDGVHIKSDLTNDRMAFLILEGDSLHPNGGGHGATNLIFADSAGTVDERMMNLIFDQGALSFLLLDDNTTMNQSFLYMNKTSFFVNPSGEAVAFRVSSDTSVDAFHLISDEIYSGLKKFGFGKTTLEAWHTDYIGLQIGGLSSLWAHAAEAAGSHISVINNVYYDGEYKRIVNDETCRIALSNGSFYWYANEAAAPDVGFIPTERMRLTAYDLAEESAQLGLGTNTPMLNVCTAAGDITGDGIHIKSDIANDRKAFLVIEGDSLWTQGGHTAASLILANNDGDVNEKMFEMTFDNVGGDPVIYLRTLQDNAVTTQQILATMNFADRTFDIDGAISSNTLTHAAAGPTDNLDVTNVNTVFINASANHVVIGGFVGGVDGQVLQIAIIAQAGDKNVTLEHIEGGGDQDIYLHLGADETLTGEYGGWTLVCNGTNWYDVSHAKHV